MVRTRYSLIPIEWVFGGNTIYMSIWTSRPPIARWYRPAKSIKVSQNCVFEKQNKKFSDPLLCIGSTQNKKKKNSSGSSDIDYEDLLSPAN